MPLQNKKKKKNRVIFFWKNSSLMSTPKGICVIFGNPELPKEFKKISPPFISFLNAIQIKVNYSIIINKSTKRFFEEIKKEDNYPILFASFNSGKHKTDNFYFFPKDNDMEDQDNMIPPLPQELKDFIEKAPQILIMEEQVVEVKADQFEELKVEFEEEINLIKKGGIKRVEVI